MELDYCVYHSEDEKLNQCDNRVEKNDDSVCKRHKVDYGTGKVKTVEELQKRFLAISAEKKRKRYENESPAARRKRNSKFNTQLSWV